jgi:short-subunit dehydrogenase
MRVPSIVARRQARQDERPEGRAQVVVVTGSSGGIGRATARAFGARGAAVALLARGEAGLEAAEREVREAGGRAIRIPTDTSDYRMLPRDHGTIVQVGSTLAYRGIPLQTAYCGSKHAIQGFHESLRTELLHDKSRVHVTMVQMPAVNTPQFSWVLSRLPHQAQPVPPIYQPEVAAKAVLYAADHPQRREYWVGGSTMATLLANAVAPGLLDRYLARTGFSSQQTSQPKDPDQPANLWDPADGRHGRDFGAHGRFDDQSTSRSAQLWASQHHGALATMALSAAATVAAVAWRRAR